MEINTDDLVIDTYRGAFNDCAVRITHMPSSLCVFSEDQPTQDRNYEAAMRLLHDAMGN
jgi:protein subunit release factor A